MLLKKVRFTFLLVFLFINLNTFSQKTDSIPDNIHYYKITDGLNYGYTKTKFWDIFKYIPSDFKEFGKFTIQKENLKWDGLALLSTAALIPFDQQLIDESDRIGKKLGGWDEKASYKTVGLLRIIPQNIPSAVYYIGNGGTTLLLSGMFYTIGKVRNNDLRALNTSNELVEVLFSVGTATQILKRITGRQSPNLAIRDGNDGGAWRPFTNFKTYQNNVSNYDAMPSGHMATYMATIAVMATNYPEIKWIKPVGYTLGGALAFNMMSGKVHWASDYPIAVLMGYVMGKNIANRRITKQENTQNLSVKKSNFNISYNFEKIEGVDVVGAVITF